MSATYSILGRASPTLVHTLVLVKSARASAFGAFKCAPNVYADQRNTDRRSKPSRGRKGPLHGHKTCRPCGLPTNPARSAAQEEGIPTSPSMQMLGMMPNMVQKTLSTLPDCPPTLPANRLFTLCVRQFVLWTSNFAGRWPGSWVSFLYPVALPISPVKGRASNLQIIYLSWYRAIAPSKRCF